MPHRVRACVLGVSLVLALPAVVAGQTVSDHRAWFDVSAQRLPRAGSRWQAGLEAIARRRDGLRTRDVFGVRASLLRRLSARSTLGGGYLYARLFAAPGVVVVEHRVYAQFATSLATAAGTVGLRTRAEARFIDGNGGEVTRLRQQVRFTHPWRPGSRVALTGYEELLVHVNGGARSPRGVDQNRLFGGVSLALTAGRLEVGYVHDILPGHGHATKVRHVLSMVVVVPF